MAQLSAEKEAQIAGCPTLSSMSNTTHKTLKQQREERMAAKAEAKRIKELAKLGSETKQAVMGQILAAMEPAIQHAVAEERTRELSLANLYMEAKKAEATLTPKQFAHDQQRVARDEKFGYWDRTGERIRNVERSVERYIDPKEGKQRFSRENPYIGPVVWSAKAMKQLNFELENVYRPALTSKLREAFGKHVPNDVTTLVSCKVAMDVKGFVAAVQIERKDGMIAFQTRCIPAAGYNIVHFHYRYITKVLAGPARAA